MPTNPVPWIMPQYLVDALGGGNLPVVTPTYRTYQGTMDGAEFVPGQIIQYASYDRMKSDTEDSGLLEPGTYVMYDLEGWNASPQSDRDAPYQSMRKFAIAAHNAGLNAIAVPGGLVDAERAAKLSNADVFVAQIQAAVDPARYKTLAAKLRKALGPSIPLITELSVGRATSVKVLQKQWLAARPYCDGFALWYGSPDGVSPGIVHKAGNFDQQAQRATAFLRWVYDYTH